MRLKKIWFAVFSFPLFLSGCGGDNTSPYDGTWVAVYPVDAPSTITDTKTVFCDTTPATLIIKDDAGTAIQTTSCVTTILATATTPQIVYPPQNSIYYISVNIEPSKTSGENDVLNAIVNGASFTGECISTRACAATSAEATLSLTR